MLGISTLPGWSTVLIQWRAFLVPLTLTHILTIACHAPPHLVLARRPSHPPPVRRLPSPSWSTNIDKTLCLPPEVVQIRARVKGLPEPVIRQKLLSQEKRLMPPAFFRVDQLFALTSNLVR